jgi:hypothetical protein
MRRSTILGVCSFAGLCLLASSPVFADDAVVCPKYALEWVEMNSPSLSEVDALLAKAPPACKSLRTKVEDYRKSVAKAPNPVLDHSDFRFELTGCTRKGPGAECMATVTVKRDVNWALTGRDKLVRNDGTPIPISWMSVGGRSASFDGRGSGGGYEKIEAGLASQVTFRFDAPVEPNQVQALVVAIGASLSGRTVALSPIPWK